MTYYYYYTDDPNARFWLVWIQGGGTFHANIILPWEAYSRGDTFRRRRSALAVRDVATVVQYDTTIYNRAS